MRRNTEADIWAKIDSSAGTDGCWPWRGSISHNGYGCGARLFDRYWRAHRLVYFLKTEEQPEQVCHRCDNPICCNPAHLFGGTQLENNRDAFAKGRKVNPKGEKHHYAKLTDDQARAIRYADVRWPEEIDYLASAFGLTGGSIYRVRSPGAWRHLND